MRTGPALLRALEVAWRIGASIPAQRSGAAAELGNGRKKCLGIDRFAEKTALRNRRPDYAHHRLQITAQQNSRDVAAVPFAQLPKNVESRQFSVEVIICDEYIAGPHIEQQALRFCDRGGRARVEAFEA